MRSLHFFFAFTLSFLGFLNFGNADEFAHHSVALSKEPCKTLDFNTYFKAQNSKQAILRANPDLTHPNFAGKYLLLKNELMMEVQWLIANCTTGKFLHETLYGKVEFRPDSSLVVILPEEKKDGSTDEQAELKLWQGEQWVTAQVSAPNLTETPSPQSSVPNSNPKIKEQTDLLQKYETLYADHTVTGESKSCKNLDFNSYFRAMQSKTDLLKVNPKLSEPNFAGHYLLLKNENLADTVWLIADCKTGKFFQTTITGKANFKSDSDLVVLRDTGSAPTLMVWNEEQWMQVGDPISKKHQQFKNTIYGEPAKKLMTVLQDGKKMDFVRFDHLICHFESSGVAEDCTVEVSNQKAKSISKNGLPDVSALVKKWGLKRDNAPTDPAIYEINLGKCSIERAPTLCTLEVQTVAATPKKN